MSDEIARPNGKYDISKIPDAGSQLVLAAKQDVLVRIDLDELMKDMRLVADLMFVASCGAAEHGDLKELLSKLQLDYGRACGDTIGSMDLFKKQCDVMLESLPEMFLSLKQNEVSDAVASVNMMIKAAERLAAEADKLRTIFSKIQDEAAIAASKADGKVSTEEQNKKKTEQARLEAQQDKATAELLIKEIDQSLAELDKLYKEAKETAEKHENRAFAVELVGAIMKPIGQAIGVAGALALKSKMPPELPPLNFNQPKKDKKKSDNPKLAAAETTQTTADTAVTAAEKEVKTCKKNVRTATADLTAAEKAHEDAVTENARVKKDKKAKDKEKTDAEKAEKLAKTARGTAATALEEAEDELATAEGALTEAKKAAEKAKGEYDKLAAVVGLGAGISDAGDAMTAMGSNYADIAKRYHEEKIKLLDKMLQQKDQKLKFLEDISRFGNKMANLRVEADHLVTVVRALQVAASALTKISLILEDTVVLWRNMAEGCKTMGSKTEFQKDLIDGIAQRAVGEERQKAIDKYFGNEKRLEQIVALYASWKAMQAISEQCGTNAATVQALVRANVQQRLSGDLMLKKAIEMGQKLSLMANESIEKTENEQATIEQGKTAPAA